MHYTVKTYYKYPRTPHFAWSPGKTRDDRVMQNEWECFGKQLVAASIKMDGECTSLYPDYIHARSIDSKDHESRHWIKALHKKIAYLIPKGWRICGENLYAKHSIHYKNLPSYFAIYSIWDNNNKCISWGRAVDMCQDLGLWHVPTVYIGMWDAGTRSELQNSLGSEDEGYVVRLYKSFHYDDFETSVAKYVREDHVQTDKHWVHQKIVKNEIV